MDAFAPRSHRPLDYWFWKFHVDDLAFLADVIVRRATGRAEVRVSLWQGDAGRVIHAESAEWSAAPDRITVGPCELSPGRSVGTADNVSWDLRWSDGGVVITPLGGPLARIDLFDTTIHTWPLCRFDGWVEVAGRRYELRNLAGAFYHYWARALSRQWVWLSATEFEDDPTRRVEGLVAIRTRVLGGPEHPAQLGYVWSSAGGRSDLTVSTVNGLVRTRDVPGGIEIRSGRLGGPRHALTATWGTPTPNDIGDGIVQTMRGELVFDGHRAVPGTVGLETRAWPTPEAVARMTANR